MVFAKGSGGVSTVDRSIHVMDQIHNFGIWARRHETYLFTQMASRRIVLLFQVEPTRRTDIGVLSNSRRSGNQGVLIQFNSDGTVTWRIDDNRDWSGGDSTTEPFASFAPNGAVLVNENRLYAKGVVNGRVTVGAKRGIYIDDDLIYAANPPVWLFGLYAGTLRRKEDLYQRRSTEPRSQQYFRPDG